MAQSETHFSVDYCGSPQLSGCSGLRAAEAYKEQVPIHQRSSTTIDRYIGRRMRFRRLEINLSQERLGAELGITAQQLQKYERGTNRICASRLHRIAQILNVPITYFFRDIDQPVLLEEEEADTPLGLALEDVTTIRLLKMFSDVTDTKLRNKIVNIVEAVIQTE